MLKSSKKFYLITKSISKKSVSPKCFFSGFTFSLIPALHADLIEHLEQRVDFELLLLFSAHVEYSSALVHHYKAAAIFQRKTQVVRDHEGGHLFFLHEFIRNAHHGLGGFRVECGGVLVED